MKTIGEIFQLSVQFLQQKKIPRPKYLIQELLCHVLSLDKVSLFVNFERPLEEAEVNEIRSLLTLLAKGKPIEQIRGEVEFFNCKIIISPDVLIPRPETEILLDILSKEIPNEKLEVWDVCTGSGYIGISFKKLFSKSHVVLSDISSKALALARLNAQRNEVDVEILEGDLLLPFKGRKADLILCNPPYISSKEYMELDPSVKDFEPELALVGGETGYEFYERMEKEMPAFLNSGAKVYFEIGYNQGKRLLELFSRPIWRQKRIMKDFAGHDRFFFLEIE